MSAITKRGESQRMRVSERSREIVMKSFSVLGVPGLTVVASVALLVSANTQALGAGPSAQAASTIDGTDTAHLHLVHQEETVVSEEGTATGKLPGRMKAELTIGSTFAGSCTIYTAGGSITGRGTATPHGSGRYESFHGTLAITGGSGRFAHAHGRTELYGTFDRRTFALVIQTKGDFSY
jgi:hypothetical protein